MKKPSVILDTILTFAASWLLFAAIASYFTQSAAVTVSAAITAAAAVTYFTGKISAKRRLPKRRRRKLNELLNKFVFSPPEYAHDFTMKAISNKHTAVEKNGFIFSGTTAFLVKLIPEKISFATLASAYAAAAQSGAERLVILTAYGGEPETSSTAALLKSPATEIWDFEKVYDFYSHLNFAPTETLSLDKPKRKVKEALTATLRRENARGYLFTAIVTLMFAGFVPHGVYYVCISAICITLALLCRIDVTMRFKRKRET